MRKRNLLFGRECSLPLDLFVSTKIHPREIKINDIKRFIVNSSASVQYENISVVLSKRRDIIEQAPTYEISELVFAYDKAMPVSILLALISVATCWLLWKYRAILTNLVRLKIK